MAMPTILFVNPIMKKCKNMKSSILFCLFMLLALQCNCVDLDGIWQYGSSVSCGNARYEFSGNKFSYHDSEDDQLNLIRSFGGEYEIKDDEIILHVRYIEQICDTLIFSRNPLAMETDGWSVTGRENRRDTLWTSHDVVIPIEITEDSISLELMDFYRVR